jgi:all-trans-retinol 13,14-reductase
MTNHYDVLIIGSGLGGLLCGYILTREGMSVCILEKDRKPGGALRTFRRHGVEFDTGVHYVGGLDKGQNLNRYFDYFGLNDKVQFRKLDEDGFDVIAIGGSEFPIAMGFENFVDRLLPLFQGKKEMLVKYTSSLHEISRAFPLYNLEIPGRNREDIYRERSAFGFFSQFSGKLNGEFHKPNEKPLLPDACCLLPAVLSGNNFLYGNDPAKTPLSTAALINHSFISSAWRPVDGTAQIAETLVDGIRSGGGEVLTQKDVCRISNSGETFTVLCDDGEEYFPGNLIAAIHPATAIKMLDPSLVKRSWSDRILGLENTTGCFTLYIVLKEESFPYLNYNYYYHRDENVWSDPARREWPAGYMLQTPVYSGTGEFARSLVIMTFMDYSEVQKWENTLTGDRGQEYLDFKQDRAEKLLALAERKFPGISGSVLEMEVSTPLTWRDYTGTPGGSMYGIQKDWNRSLETSVTPKTKIPGFFFTGQNVNLHGVLGVTIGSVLTCGEMTGLDYLLKKIRHDG